MPMHTRLRAPDGPTSSSGSSNSLVSLSSPTHPSRHTLSAPASCTDLTRQAAYSCIEERYGPHTSTIRMNPYVRCVHDSGVPEIRSLKELLSLKQQPEHAGPDTPCLRPRHGPCSTWGTSDRRERTPTLSAGDPGLSDMTGAGECTDADRSSSQNKLSTTDVATTPVLSFTADSVATPNTFATVVTHERRIFSHMSRRLRRSARRHPDMPLGEPMEMLLSAEVGDPSAEELEEGEEEVGEEWADERRGLSAASAEGEAGEDEEEEDGGSLLPCSTREKAAAAAAAAHAGERSVAQPIASTSGPMQEDDARRLLEQCNERILSPHTSSGVLCEMVTVNEEGRYSSKTITSAGRHATSATQRLKYPGISHGRSCSDTSSTTSAIAATPAASLSALTFPAPVARLEESPYHYIMRNYVGGTFLYYSTQESKDYFLRLCHRVVAQVRPLLEQETVSPSHGLFPRVNAPAYVFGDIHGNFEDLSFFLQRLLIFHDFNLTPANILCLGDYVDRGPFSLECVMLLFSLKIMNASKMVMLRGNHEDRVVCGDLRTYGQGCFLGQCQTVFGYTEGMKLFREVTALFKYLPLAAELVIPRTPNRAFLRAQQTITHPNLYVSQPAVLIHDEAAPVNAAAQQTSFPDTAADGQMSLGGQRHDSPLMPTAASGFAATPASFGTTGGGYSTIADASLACGQPSRHESHEERILCTHGGIPRFDRPPLEDDALRALRSLAFPRMLTLFPNNPMASSDPECAPDYFARKELPALWRRYPSTAPPAFTAALRRESAQAQRGATRESGESPSDECSYVEETLVRSKEAASSSLLSNAEKSIQAVEIDPRRESVPLLSRSCSRDFLPQLTDNDVSKSWYTMFDLLWSDPTPMELEESTNGAATNQTAAASPAPMHINEWGFGVNMRGSNVVSFSARAVDTFLTAYHYSMLFRAHQEKAHGLRWSKSNKVLTIFSSSNYMGHRNGAGCVVVAANGEVQLVEKVCL